MTFFAWTKSKMPTLKRKGELKRINGKLSGKIKEEVKKRDSAKRNQKEEERQILKKKERQLLSSQVGLK